MLLDRLPHELQLQVISDLDNQDLQTLLQSNANLLAKSKQDTFWKDLCTLKGISYHHPDVAWKELYQSGSVNTMCPHLRLRGIQDKKKEQFWSLLDQKNMDSSLMFCLHSSCEFLGKSIHIGGQMKKNTDNLLRSRARFCGAFTSYCIDIIAVTHIRDLV